MGIFDKVFGGGGDKITLNRAEAFAGVLLATAAADGHISQEEGNNLFAALSRMQMFASFSGDQMQAIMNKLMGIIKRQGPGALVSASAATCPPELKPTVFCLAVDLVLSDGVVDENEKKIINHIQDALSVPDEVASKIIDVMMIKNKG